MSIYGTYIQGSYDKQYLNESIIGRLIRLKKKILPPKEIKDRYYCTLKETSEGNNIDDIFHEFKCRSEAIYFLLMLQYHLSKEKDGKHMILKSYYNKLEKENPDIYICKGTLHRKETSTNADYFTMKVYSVEVKKAVALVNELNIGIKDNSEIIKTRTKMFNDIFAITKKVFKEIEKQFPKIKDGFSVCDYKDDSDEEDKEAFISGIDNSIDIVWCDAWGYTDNNARNQDKLFQYQECWEALYDKLSEELSRYGRIEYNGDWDDGPITLYVK